MGKCPLYPHVHCHLYGICIRGGNLTYATIGFKVELFLIFQSLEQGLLIGCVVMVHDQQINNNLWAHGSKGCPFDFR